MIHITLALIFGLIITEIVYFGFMRKSSSVAFTTHERKYSFVDFFFDKLVSCWVGSFFGYVAYELSSNFKEYDKEILCGILIFIMVVIFFFMNWYISNKLDAKRGTR